MSTETTIRDFILTELADSDDIELDAQTPLLGGGLLDSLSLTRLIAFLEQQFGVTIDTGDVVPENFETIATVVALLGSKGAHSA
jgi:acyl carrier protein